jgi:hypothetical protein
MTRSQADELAAQLELDPGSVCFACLCIVSFALEGGRPNEIAAALTRITPDLWDDGLEGQVVAAAARACELGVPNAREALADLEQSGADSIVARAIVRRLAEELSDRTRTSFRWEAAMN